MSELRRQSCLASSMDISSYINSHKSLAIHCMKALLKSISRFFRRLFGLSKPNSPSSSATNSACIPPPDTSTPQPKLYPAQEATPKLRRLVYEVAYRLRQDQPTQGAQVGPVFRQVDSNFSAKRYGFAKMIDLLEAVPALVHVDKEMPDSATGQYVFYVRPAQNIRNLLTEAIAQYNSEDGWIHEDSLKEAIAQQDPNFSVQTFGFSSFRDFIESRYDLLEFKGADSPYIRLFPERIRKRADSNRESYLNFSGLNLSGSNFSDSNFSDSNLPGSNLPDSNPFSSNVSSPNFPDKPIPPVVKPRPTRQKVNIHLTSFARLGEADLNQSVYELAALADDEPWYFGSKPPEEFPHPILRNYIRHMFTRVQHEGKLASSQSGQLYTFHTNLYDKLRRPIYALMIEQPKEGDEAYGRPALKLAFGVPGEAVGKNLVGQFGSLPPAANFMSTPQRFFYYCEAGPPTVNWTHIIEDNMDRLPPDFLRQYLPAFEFSDTGAMSKMEVGEYKARFAQALEADAAAYREVVSRFEKALELTMFRIQRNYKVAVPTYFASHDRIDLMLPLSLVDEGKTDCALVVKQERSGNYSGNTIFTMEQAYNNARLIYKPVQRWLVHPETLQPEETAVERVD